MGGVSEQQRDGAGQQRSQRGPLAVSEIRQRREQAHGREEHDRRRALGGAPLELVQPPHRRLVQRVAAEPVDGVGREHSDAA